MVAVGVALLAAFCAPLAAASAVVTVGNATQLLFDDQVIASVDGGLTRNMNVPKFASVVVQPGGDEAPWEVGFSLVELGTSIVRIPGSCRLRMYYTLRWGGLDAHGVPLSHTKALADMYLTAIAESRDGVSWNKPLLQRPFYSRYNGANVSKSNIIGESYQLSDKATPMIWVDEDAPPSSRWRAVGWAPNALHAIQGCNAVRVSYSSDGLSWRQHSVIAVPSTAGSGGYTQPIVIKDPGCGGCLALFTRTDGPLPATVKHPRSSSFREVRRVDVLSLDGNGSTARQAVVMQADSIDLRSHDSVAPFPPMGYYGSTVWVRELGSGQRAYFMMPVRYWHWEGGNARPGEGGEPATYDVALAASRNGWKFSFLGERQPFARPTRDGSVGVSRMWVRPPIRMGNEDFFFVTRGNMNEDAEVANTTDGSPKRLRGEVALGRLRLDGTISIDGKYGQAGNLTTKVLVFHGAKLRLNVNAGGGGAVTVFVRTPTGKHLLGPSKPVVHNGVNEEVVWPNGCLSCLAGQPVVLSFSIEEAKLFTFRFVHKSDDVTHQQNTAAASSEPTITSKTTKTVRLWTGSRFPVATRSTDPFTLNLARYLNATEKLRDVVDVVSPSCFSMGGLNDTYSPGLPGLHMQPGCRQRVLGLHAQGFRVEPMISNGENSTIEVIRLRLREPTFVHACALAMYILNASGLVFDLELEKSDVADGLSFAEMLSAVRTKLRLHVADAVVSVATGTGAMSKTDVLVNSTVDQFISMGTYWALKYFQSGIQRDMGRVGRARYACGLCDSCAAELRGGNNTVASIDERFRSLATDEVLHLAWWLLEYDSPGSPLPASFQHKHWWQKIREWKRSIMKSDDVEPGENCHHSATAATAAVLSNSTLEWWRWVVVRVANQAAWIKPNDTDARDVFVTLFDPDMFDWGGDFRWQAGEWAGLRGIPVAQATQFEYQMAFDGFNTSSQGTSVILAAFGNSSVSTDVNGHPVVNGVWPYMTHAAPLWHMACVQGAARVALAGDAVTQDNAAGNLNSRVFSGGFGAWENKKFIASPFGAALGLNVSFKIQSYVKILQNEGLHGDVLVREPIISAFIRFTYELWRDAWVDLRTSAKKIAMKQGKLLPAVYGNIGNKYPVFELIESTHHDVYWIESFVRMATPAQQPEQYPGVDTTITIKAAQSADRQKPIWRCTQDVKTQSEARIYFAEASANGANEWLLNGMMQSTLPPSQSTVGTWGKINGNLVTHGYGYDEHLRHAQFSNSAARFLLTDRHRIADGAVIYCLACSLWRGLVGTLGHSSPLLFQNSLPTTGRLLEHSHASWEFVAFGHSDLWQPPPQTRVRLAAPSRWIKPYVWVILPNVEGICAHAGGTGVHAKWLGGTRTRQPQSPSLRKHQPSAARPN